MSVEHQPHQPERGPEQARQDLAAERERRLEELREQAEKGQAERPEHRAETAREVIRKQEQTPEPVAAEKAGRSIPLLSPRLNYEHTMASVRRHLSPASRRFSTFIHSPAVERTAEACEKTVARPSVVLGATWTALIVGVLFYSFARRFGYALSGSEILLSLVAGAVIGLALEGLWRLLRRN